MSTLPWSSVSEKARGIRTRQRMPQYMALNDFPWLSMTFNDCQWLSMTLNDSQRRHDRSEGRKRTVGQRPMFCLRSVERILNYHSTAACAIPNPPWDLWGPWGPRGGQTCDWRLWYSISLIVLQPKKISPTRIEGPEGHFTTHSEKMVRVYYAPGTLNISPIFTKYNALKHSLTTAAVILARAYTCPHPAPTIASNRYK